MQQQQPLMGLVGSTTRPKRRHSDAELRLCKSKGDACRLAILTTGMSQEFLSDRLAVTAGYLSMLLSGKRQWSDGLQRRLMQITGSLAPLQWDAMQEGVELYVDPVKVREAELLQELEQLRRAA